MSRKKKPPRQDATEDPSAATHKAFRRMAFIFANLVCGIWLILLGVTTAVEESSPDVGLLAAMVVVGAPVAYAIPYGLVRLIGFVVIALKRRPNG